MDGQRFDEVTKAFATGTSRRSVLRAALGGMTAGLLGLAGGTGASAKGARTSSDVGPVPCGEIEGLECSDGFTCVEGFCLEDDGAAGKRHCVEECKEQFGPGRQRGQCISACANGKGGGIPPEPVSCGDIVCGAGEFCCNESCGICAPIGGSCTQEFCGED